MAEVTDAAKTYEKGMGYLEAARRIAAQAGRLEPGDASKVRWLADRITKKGLALLGSVVKPTRSDAPPAQG